MNDELNWARKGIGERGFEQGLQGEDRQRAPAAGGGYKEGGWTGEGKRQGVLPRAVDCKLSV